MVREFVTMSRLASYPILWLLAAFVAAIPSFAQVTSVTLQDGQRFGGTLASDIVLEENGTFTVTNTVIVPSPRTLTIKPGARILFGSGMALTVSNGGRLLAEGTTNAPIIFSRAAITG